MAIPTAVAFSQLLSSLTSNHRLIAFDLPGIGESSDAPDPERTYTLQGSADAAIELDKNVLSATRGPALNTVGRGRRDQVARSRPTFRRRTKWSAASSYRGGPLGADAGRLVATLVAFRPSVLLQSGTLPSRSSFP